MDGSELVILPHGDADMLAELADGVLDGGVLDVGGDGLPLPEPDDTSVYSADVQRLAFQVWAFEAGRDLAMTREMVKDRCGVEVPVSALRSWARVGSWGKVAAKVHQTLTFRSNESVRQTLSLGIVRATRWMVQCLDDPAVPPQVKVKAAMSLLDRGGFPTLIRGELWTGLDAVGGDLAGLSDDALEAEYMNYRATPDESTQPIEHAPADTLIELMQQEQYAHYTPPNPTG